MIHFTGWRLWRVGQGWGNSLLQQWMLFMAKKKSMKVSATSVGSILWNSFWIIFRNSILQYHYHTYARISLRVISLFGVIFYFIFALPVKCLLMTFHSMNHVVQINEQYDSFGMRNWELNISFVCLYAGWDMQINRYYWPT